MSKNSEKEMSDLLDDHYKSEIQKTEGGYKNIKIPLNFINKSLNSNPEYATDGSSGFDIKASLEHEIEVKPGKREIIPTGLFFDIPEGFEIQVRPRSGLAAKYGITVLNSPGTIDSDYTGEIKIILLNTSHINFIVNNGDRIAQGVIGGVISKRIVAFTQVDKIDKNTKRGSGGFGSTGIN